MRHTELPKPDALHVRVGPEMMLCSFFWWWWALCDALGLCTHGLASDGLSERALVDTLGEGCAAAAEAAATARWTRAGYCPTQLRVAQMYTVVQVYTAKYSDPQMYAACLTNIFCGADVLCGMASL